MAAEFNDSIEHNLEIIREVLSGLPPSSHNDAKRAAIKVEKVITDLQRDHQGSAGAALGTAFAIYTIAQRLVQSSQSGNSEGAGLIKLLS